MISLEWIVIILMVLGIFIAILTWQFPKIMNIIIRQPISKRKLEPSNIKLPNDERKLDILMDKFAMHNEILRCHYFNPKAIGPGMRPEERKWLQNIRSYKELIDDEIQARYIRFVEYFDDKKRIQNRVQGYSSTDFNQLHPEIMDYCKEKNIEIGRLIKAIEKKVLDIPAVQEDSKIVKLKIEEKNKIHIIFCDTIAVEKGSYEVLKFSLQKGDQISGTAKEIDAYNFSYYLMDEENSILFDRDEEWEPIDGDVDISSVYIKAIIPRNGVWCFIFEAYGKQISRDIDVEIRKETATISKRG